MGIEDESITGGCEDALCGEDAFFLDPTVSDLQQGALCFSRKTPVVPYEIVIPPLLGHS